MSQKGGGDYVTSKDWKKAYEDYSAGLKYTEIAEKYGISLSAVKMKALREWKEKNVTEKGKVTRKKGSPIKHGAYEKIFWDSLDDEEQELKDDVNLDCEKILIEELKLYTIRERRLLKRIERYNNLSDNKDKLTINDIRKRHTETEIEDNKTTTDETITNAISQREIIEKLESELTKVQTGKNKCVMNLVQLQKEKVEHSGIINNPLKDLTTEELRKLAGEINAEY